MEDHEDIKNKCSSTGLATKKVKLENGTYNYIFTKNYDDNGKLYYRCNVCDVVVGGSLAQHSSGRKHQTGMALPYHPVSLWAKSLEKPMIELKLAPGEPVPPGFEDEVRGITEIQASLDAYHSGPLIGLEYLIELSAFEDEREPQYICLLCDKRGDPRTVMAHLVSFNHRMTYLQTHFPTVFRTISPYNTKQYRRNVQTTVTNICEAIEKKYGRMVPQTADRESFERKKQSFMEGTVKDNHPSERLGETFEYLVDKEAILSGPKDVMAEIKKANEEVVIKSKNIRKSGSHLNDKRDPSPPFVAAPGIKMKSSTKQDRRSLSSISSISSSDLSSPRSRSHSRSRDRGRIIKNRRYIESGSRRSRSRSRSPHRRYYRRSRSHSRSPPRYKRESYSYSYYSSTGTGNSRLPWQRSDYVRSRNNYVDRRSESKSDSKNDKMEEFKKQCVGIENDMEKVLEQHEKNPEKHPMYPEEWKKFWNRRYKELQAENKDPTKHDFKPEWIDFWNKRMKEMHDSDVKAKKDALRKKLNLPDEPTPISFKIVNKKKIGSKGQENEEKKTSDDKIIEPDIIVIDDSKDDDSIRERKRSKSPWESDTSRDRERERDRDRDRERERDRDRYGTDYTRDYYRSRSYRNISYEKEREREPKRRALSPALAMKEQDEEINIVAILRLLTALEEKLGSLGPKVIDMLAQALALEKAEANSSETLLDNEINCVLFETVKEKLKGQLLAGMVEHSAEKTFKNAIQRIATVLHFASERKKTKEKELNAKNLEPVKIPGIGAIDKSAIAKQIATALIAQGKTDVTQNELEQLINAVVGMAKASQSSGKTISTASFVQQLSNPMLSSIDFKSTNSLPKVDNMLSAVQLLQSTSNSSDAMPLLSTTNTMDGLSDSDLKTLLQNFKDLSTDEQHGLITYLKKLEAREPDRVERLRKFVKLGPTGDLEKSYTSGRISPFSNRESSVNPSLDDLDKNKSVPATEKLKIDSDDEDYSFEDVFRAASKNVKEKQLADERKKMEEISKIPEKSKDSFTDAKTLIANLMGQLGKKNNLSTDLLGLGSGLIPSVSNSIIEPEITNTSTYGNVLTTAVNPNLMQNFQNTSQYNFPQTRPYDPMYDTSYPAQMNYQPNQTFSSYNHQTPGQVSSDYNTYSDQRLDYNNTYTQTSSQRVISTQYSRSGQQYSYDRKNYY